MNTFRLIEEIEFLKCEVNYYKSEVDRLKSGDFTEQEFQNLCHKFNENDEKRFIQGCEEYQKKLFDCNK